MAQGVRSRSLGFGLDLRRSFEAAFTAASGKRGRRPPRIEAALVKVCGVTRPEDAALAADFGADYIGMIMWPKAGRYVKPSLAREIATAARDHGAEPVGVFVDEDSDTIQDVCSAASVSTAQLHGQGARAALRGLPADIRVVYVLHADADGQIKELPPAEVLDRAQFLLIDGQTGGSGKAFAWQRLMVPEGFGDKWFLAGGLGPGNVIEAIKVANPVGVDVSSGVCGPDKLKKDADKLKKFVELAKCQEH